VKTHCNVILNLTARLTGVASDPDIRAFKIVLAFQVSGDTTSDIYLSGVNGQIHQITDTSDVSEVTPIFHKGRIVYVANGELHLLIIDGSRNIISDEVIGQGTNPASSDKGNLSYTGTSGTIIIDDQDTGIVGTSVNWIPNGLLYLGADGDLYLLNPDLSSTLVGGTDFAPDPNSKALNGLVSVSGSGDVWYFDPSETVVTGYDQDWWSIFGTDTGW
jgi:hypothetical protein